MQQAMPDNFRIQSRGCMVTIGKALREGWQMSPECLASITGQLHEIVANDSRERWKIRARKTLIQLEASRSGV